MKREVQPPMDPSLILALILIAMLVGWSLGAGVAVMVLP